MRRDMRSRRMRDMRRGRRKDYAMGTRHMVRDGEHYPRKDYMEHPKSTYETYGPSRKHYGEYDMGYDYHYDDIDYRGRRYDYGYDYSDGLNREELMDWQRDLEHEIDPQYRNMFEKGKVIQRAKEMGVDFKDFDEEEFVTTVMMIASDFGRTLGMNETDKMYRMAYDWLNDPDAGIRGSEKLAVYYDEIVCAGE